MLVHLDTSLLVDAFTGPRRSLLPLRRAIASHNVVTFSTLVLYEWSRGPRTPPEREVVAQFFPRRGLADFDAAAAERAAVLYRQAARARQRHADLAIAACALEQGAQFWTLNTGDFADIPDLRLYGEEG